MIIQEIKTSDQELISSTSKLAKEIWTEHYTPIIGIEQVEYMLDKFQSVEAIENQLKDSYRYFSVSDDNQIVGYFSIQLREHRLFLSKAYVRKEHRGKGIFNLMLLRIINIAKDYGLNKIELTVNKENNHTIEVYKTKGFIVIQEAIFDIGNGYVMDDYVLQLKI